MTGASAEPVYITPTPRERLRFVLAWGAFYVWFASHFAWLPGMVARLDTPDLCTSLGTLQFLVAYLVVATSIPALLFGSRAWRTRRATQYPPPGSWVLFRTRVYTDRWWVILNKGSLAAMAVVFAMVPLTILRELDGWQGLLAIFFDHGC